MGLVVVVAALALGVLLVLMFIYRLLIAERFDGRAVACAVFGLGLVGIAAAANHYYTSEAKPNVNGALEKQVADLKAKNDLLKRQLEYQSRKVQRLAAEASARRKALKPKPKPAPTTTVTAKPAVQKPIVRSARRRPTAMRVRSAANPLLLTNQTSSWVE